MPLPSLATIEQYETRAGSSTDNSQQLQWLLDQASAIVRAYTRQTWVDDDGDLDGVPDGVPGVVVDMVYRVEQNPEGVTQDTAGPFSVAFGANAAERLYLAQSEKLILDAHRRSGLTVLGVSRGPVETAGPPLFCDWPT